VNDNGVGKKKAAIDGLLLLVRPFPDGMFLLFVVSRYFSEFYFCASHVIVARY
jgi:hypothetical protein